MKFIFAFLFLTAPLLGDWESYYQHRLNTTEPHITTSLAQNYFELEGRSGGTVADLGTGTGRDALFLLEKGWRVIAIDKELLALEILTNRAEAYLDHLELKLESFSDMTLPENLDFINASYSLPFCSPEDFPHCWEKICGSLRDEGRFAGHFFGDEDGWVHRPSMTFLKEEEVKNLFQDRFKIEYFQVEKGLIPCANGDMKFWHRYHVVAQKIR